MRSPEGEYLDGQIYKPGEALPVGHVLAGLGVVLVGQAGDPLSVTSTPAQGQLATAIPAANAEGQVVRVVPTGAVAEAQTLGVSLQNEVTATGNPTPTQKGIVTREALTDWSRYPAKGVASVASARHLIYAGRSRLVYLGAYNPNANARWIWLHDVALAANASAANAVAMGIYLPPKTGTPPGWFRNSFSRAEISFIDGIVATVSDSAYAWSLSADTVHIEAGYQA